MKNTIYRALWLFRLCDFFQKTKITPKKYFVTPPHPPVCNVFLLRFILVASFVSINISIYGQSPDSLKIPDLEDLEISIKDYFQKKMEAELSEFDYKIKGQWLSYLPSVGFSFGLPSVSWSTQNIFKISNDKRKNKSKIESIILINTLEYNKVLSDIKIEYEKIILLLEKLGQKEQIKKAIMSFLLRFVMIPTKRRMERTVASALRRPRAVGYCISTISQPSHRVY